jgi:hypothetical protein
MVKQPWRTELIVICNKVEIHYPGDNISAETCNEGKSDIGH